MIKKLILAALLVLMLLPGLVAAQETTLTYNETITGEITNEAYEVRYTFSGTAGDIIVIDLLPLDLLEDTSLNEPALILEDSQQAIVASVESQYIQQARLAVQLAADDTYTVIATRKGGRAGSDTGEFKLTVYQAPLIERGGVLEGSMTNEEVNYYAVISEENFEVEFTHLEGSFKPAMTISTVTAEGTLDDIAQLYGSLVSGSLVIDTTDQTGTLYFIRFEEALYDFYFDPVNVNYKVGLAK